MLVFGTGQCTDNKVEIFSPQFKEIFEIKWDFKYERSAQKHCNSTNSEALKHNSSKMYKIALNF